MKKIQWIICSLFFVVGTSFANAGSIQSTLKDRFQTKIQDVKTACLPNGELKKAFDQVKKKCKLLRKAKETCDHTRHKAEKACQSLSRKKKKECEKNAQKQKKKCFSDARKKYKTQQCKSARWEAVKVTGKSAYRAGKCAVKVLAVLMLLFDS